MAKPSGTLTADDGKSFNLRADTRGIVTLLYFGYTHCPDLCPLTMSNTSVAMRMLPRADQAKIRVLFVSVDPGRDTAARLRSWLGGFDPAFIGLRGTAAGGRGGRTADRPAARSRLQGFCGLRPA